MEESILGKLLDSYDRFNHFNVYPYYTVCFGSLPSALGIELSIKGSRDAADSVLKSIDLQRFAFTPVFKNWATDDFKNAKLADDYPYEYVFKSEKGRMLMHFVFRHNSLSIDFLYNLGDLESEKWLLETNHHLRSTFGITKKPKFKVLVFQDGIFSTADVNTGDFTSIDITELYNDDFSEIDTIINDSMTQKEAGIILLHGEPGTGKTTYIKHLIC